MKDKILDIITNYPRHYSKMIKNDSELKEWVESNASNTASSFPEKIYTSISNDSAICSYNNKKRFVSVNIGYSFCGKANKCQCCKKSVSDSVSFTKQEYSDTKKQAINKKREQTNLKKYGVGNVGQTSKAKNNHKVFYNNSDNIERINTKVKTTKQIKYGNANYNNREKAKDTYKQKYGYENPVHLKDINQNPNLELLKNKNKLNSLYKKLTVEQISQQLQVHPQTVYRYLNMHGLRVPYTSTFEQEIVNYLKSLGVFNIVTNTRKLISKEIDIYLPDYNLAIEYNGVYWHHDRISHVDKHYHYRKFKECEDSGIELFTIFSDSWESKKDIWKTKIRQKLNLASNVLYARKCIVKTIKPKDTRKILDENHVQGYCPSQIAYGLFFEDELVAAMTFSKNRLGIGKNRKAGSYELVRYVTSRTVVGGAGKLLSAFKKDYNPDLIYSYSDNRYSTGNLYKQLGFTLEKENKCGYWYYDPGSKKSYHRFKFSKFRLVESGFDPDKTEYQIMSELGFMRIWDCGTRTWVLN